MARGPKKKSAALDRLQGNPSHRKEAPAKKAAAIAAVPDQEAAAIRAPAWIGAGADRYWREVANGLRSQGLLRQVDAIALTRYCQWLARYVDLEKTSRRSPVVKETKSKFVKMQRTDKNFQALLAIDSKLSQFEDRFGMNPRERLAIMAKIAGDSPLNPIPNAPPATSEGTPAPLVGPQAPLTPIGILAGGRVN